MMMDVDALSGRFESLIGLHCSIANILHGVDIKNRLDAYDEHAFMRTSQTKVKIRETDKKLYFRCSSSLLLITKCTFHAQRIE